MTLVPASGSQITASPAMQDRRTAKALERLGRETLVRMAAVQADGIVHAERLREIDRLAEVAMSGHAMLARTRDVLAAGDPLLHDELGMFAEASRIAKVDALLTFARRQSS